MNKINKRSRKLTGPINEYVNLISRYSKSLDAFEKERYFLDLGSGSIKVEYEILKNPEKEFVHRIDEHTIIIYNRERGFEQELKKQINEAKKIGIVSNYSEKQNSLEIKLIPGASIDYQLNNIVSGPIKRIDVLQPKIFYLNLRDEKATIARKKLIESHLRLVTRIVERKFGADEYLEELISEANLGLMHAIDKFDIKRNLQFSSYLTIWVMKQTKSLLSKTNSHFKTNVDIYQKMSYIQKVEENFINENLSMPSELELSETIKELEENGLSFSKNKKLTKRTIKAYMKNKELRFTSVNHSEELSAFEIIDQNKGPYDLVMESDLVDKFLDKISLKGREIIARRYGLNGHKEESLEKICKNLGLGKKRVRKIIQPWFNKMRKMAG